MKAESNKSKTTVGDTTTTNSSFSFKLGQNSDKTLAVMDISGTTAVGRTLGHLFLSPLVLTIALGGLGHQLHIPYLFKFGYFESMLAVIAFQALSPLDGGTKRIFRLPKRGE